VRARLAGDSMDIPGKSWRNCLTAVRPLPTRAILTCIVLLGLALRIGWMVTEASVISSEGAEYARMAEHLLHDHALVGTFEGPEILYAPLYPVLIAGTMLVVPNSETAGHIISLLSGMALIAIVFLIAQYAYGRQTAYICALLVATHPLLVALSGSVYNESLYLTVLIAVIYRGLRALELQRQRDCLWLGACLGLAYLTRVEAVAYVPFFVVALLTVGLLSRQARAAVIGSAIVVTAFCVLASPYVAFFYNHTGRLRLEAKWDINYTMARNRLAGMTGTEADYGIEHDATIKGPILAPSEFVDFTPYSHTLVDKLGILPLMASLNRWTVYDYFLSTKIGSPMLLGLIILGLFYQPWSTRRLRHEAILLAMAGSIACITLTSSTAEFRYLFPIVPLLLLWSAKGIDELGQWIKGWELLRSRSLFLQTLIGVAVQLCAAVLIIMLATRGVHKDVTEHSTRAFAERDTGLWLAHYAPGPKRIAVRHAVIPYYAKGTLIGLPYGGSEATMRYIMAKNVDFIVLESDYTRALPTMGEWIAHGIPNARARLIYDRTNSSGDRVVIYRWQVQTDDRHLTLGQQLAD
jgi:4-amino-4-deoxy-L-arabinose transferase-like glycosyltransferase